MTEKHQGGCQCGAVRYEVEVDLESTIICNCSRCRKLGLVLAFAQPAAFTLHSGADAVTEYRFNSKAIQHLFCATCGVESYANGRGPDGTAMTAINVNCLDGVDARALESTPVDGASF